MAVEIIKSGDDRGVQACFDIFIQAVAKANYNSSVILRGIACLAGWAFLVIRKKYSKEITDDSLKVFIEQLYVYVKNNGRGYELPNLNITITEKKKEGSILQ